METGAHLIDDQPVAASFFGEGNWLTEFITPDNPDIQVLYEEVTKGRFTDEDKIMACWDWVAREVKYKPFIGARIQVEGKVARTADYWQTPAMCARTGVGNCANKAFLLTSLVRNILPADQVHCTFGNLHNGHIEGHAWVEVTLDGTDYIVESTRDDVPMVEASKKDRYEPVHYFNDKNVYAMDGRTLMTPFSACFSSWLKDYLSWDYIDYMREQ